MPHPISVLVVDDSAFMRKMVTEMLSADPALCVVGQARDGQDALRQLFALTPDVITLDVEMPVMNGLEALEQIMERRPTPTVMLSSLTQTGAETTIRCLESGAVDFVGKPSGAISLDIKIVAADLIAKIKAAAGVRKARLTRREAGAGFAALCGRPETLSTRPPSPAFVTRSQSSVPSLLVIGASTGGPRALQTLVPALPADLGIPVVIVQHMPAGFTTSLARRLDDEAPFRVREAAEGDTLTPGVALLAPGGRHLQFDGMGRVRLSNEPPVHGVRPSIDVTLASLAAAYGSRTIGVLLTGMGKDGARGLKAIRDRGGVTLAEDESTCVVYGMPKAAVELGAVAHLLPLPQIAGAVAQILQGTRSNRL